MSMGDAFEKLNGCENEETTQMGVVKLRLGRCLGWKVCPWLLTFVRLFLNKNILYTKTQCILFGKGIYQGLCFMVIADKNNTPSDYISRRSFYALGVNHIAVTCTPVYRKYSTTIS